MGKPESNVPLNTKEQILIDQKIAEEKSNINHVQDQILEVQAKLQESILQHHEHIRELNHQRNMHSATMRLPPEILHRIFQELQDLYKAENREGRDCSHRWRTVLRICQHWRTLAINSPSIWTTIHLGTRRHTSLWTNFALERSGTAMLDVVLQLSKYCNYFDEWIIVQNIARIRSLEIDIDGYGVQEEDEDIINWDQFQASLDLYNDDTNISGKATVLNRLNISFSRRVPMVSSSWFTIAPHLQHLKLSGVNFDWTNSHFCGLRTLHLANVPAVAQLSLDRIQTVFAQMSCLEDLHLSSVFAPVDGALPPTPSMKCNLPNLRRLHMKSTFSSSVALFLSSISLPSLDRFHIEILSEVSNTDDHSCLFRALSTMLQRAYHTISIQFCYVDGYCEKFVFGMYLDEGNEGSQILLPVTELEVTNLRMVDNFCTVVDFSRLARLMVEGMPAETLKTNFGFLPHLTSITTLGDFTFTGLIEALTIPLEYPQYSQLTFPALKSISAADLWNFADQDAGWDPLQDCLMQRYEYGAPVDELNLFSHTICSPDCIAKLSEIVPNVTAARIGLLI